VKRPETERSGGIL